MHLEAGAHAEVKNQLKSHADKYNDIKKHILIKGVLSPDIVLLNGLYSLWTKNWNTVTSVHTCD